MYAAVVLRTKQKEVSALPRLVLPWELELALQSLERPCEGLSSRLQMTCLRNPGPATHSIGHLRRLIQPPCLQLLISGDDNSPELVRLFAD